MKNSFYIETYGCTSNKADSYIITEILKKNGYSLNSFEEAEFIIINTCAVKQQTENKIKARIGYLNENFKESKFFIIAGCLPHIDTNYIDIVRNLIPNFSAIIDLDGFDEIPEIFNRIKSGESNIVHKCLKSSDKSKYLINYQGEKLTGIIPISEGCLGACTYCCVKNARGRLNCFNPENIIRNVNHQLEQGIKQIYLTSQDCSTYEYNNMKLYDIVKTIINLKHKFFLRIGMLNPRFLIDNFNQLLSIYELPKVYQFLHIPIQSGSNDVLKLMNRPYTIENIKEKLQILREKFPYLTISTDIICGFPGETDDNFQETVDLIQWLKPEILNISKFTPRPATKAKKMIQVNSKEIKRRSIELSNIFRESLLKINNKWKNWEGESLVLHSGTEKKQAFGRNFAYKNIFIENFSDNYGIFFKVKIYDVEGFNLYAQIIE